MDDFSNIQDFLYWFQTCERFLERYLYIWTGFVKKDANVKNSSFSICCNPNAFVLILWSSKQYVLVKKQHK